MARPKRMQGFYKRGGTWWIRNDPITKKRLSTHCTDSAAALQWKAERERLATSPAHVAAQTATVEDWVRKFLQSKREGRVTEQTVGFWESKCGHIVRLMGARSLSEVEPTLIDSYVSSRRKEGVGDYTIQRELQALTGTLKLAKRAGQCPVDFQALTPPDLDGGYTPVQRSLTPDEVGKLLQAMPTEAWRAFVAICVALGARKSEAFRIAPADFEVKTEERVTPKGKTVEVERWLVWIDGRKTESSNRVIPVLSHYVPLVKFALPHLPIGELGNIHRTFQLACRRAGIEPCSPNDLRRTNATQTGEAGVGDDIIARLLGHTTTAMAKRTYNRARAAKLAPVVEKLLEGADPIRIELPNSSDMGTAPGRKRSRGPSGGGCTGGGFDLGRSTESSHPFPCSPVSSRATVDSNHRPLAPEAGAHYQPNQQLSDIVPAPSRTILHHRAPSDAITRTKTSHPTTYLGSAGIGRDGAGGSPSGGDFGELERVRFGGQLVPLVDSAGRVVSWESVTAGEVAADLAPSRYLKRTVPSVDNSTDSLRRAARALVALVARFGGVL